MKYKVLMSLAVIALMLIPLSCGQPQAGILFEFYGSGTTREPATETQVQISIMHTCVFNDKLVLEKVEIYGESETPVKVFEVNKTLNSVFWKLKLLDALYILRWIPGASERIMQAGAKLAEEIRAESFATSYFTIDLRQIKQPLTYGNITIIAKATLIHNGERLTLEREVIAEYVEKWPGG